MTDSDIETETWKPIPGFAIRYQASTAGRIRNRNGVIMQPRRSSSGYLQINLVDDAWNTKTVTVHKCILRTFCGECPDGMESTHLNHNRHDNRLANLAWGSIAENRAAPSPARPVRQEKPKAPCILCGAPVTKGGRRCHDCVVKIGVQAVELMRGGMTLLDANEQLGYGNAMYLHNLAVRYGGWGHCQPCTCAPVTMRDDRGRRSLRRSLKRRFGKLSGDAQ